jgi:hypothetical protein
MKQKIILFTAFSTLLYITLSSKTNGPGSAPTSINATGGPGSTQTCSSASCHAGASGATTGLIEVRKKSAGSSSTPVTTYQNDTTYIVTLTCTNSSSIMTKFGFQMEAVDSVTSASSGTFSSLPTNVHSVTIASKVLIEHSSPLSKSIPTGTVSFDWKAPSSGLGVVKFFGIVNSSNNQGDAFGDVPSTNLSVSLKNAASSVGDLKHNISITAYPNPFTNILVLKMDNIGTGSYTINTFDLRGKKIAEQNTSVTPGNADLILRTDRWAAGYYMIQVEKDGYSQIISVVKR